MGLNYLSSAHLKQQEKKKRDSLTRVSTGETNACEHSQPYASLRLHFPAGTALLLRACLVPAANISLAGIFLQGMHPVSTIV